MTNEDLNKALKGIGMEPALGKAKIIELDDTINFNCKRCGQCCAGRSDIIVNPYDVYQIAKELNITMQDVIMNYCSIHHGNNSGAPIVTLKEDERKLCPFLKFFSEEGKFGCSINNSKPGACILHPIGVVRSIDTKTNTQEIHYIEVPSCSNHGTDTEVKVKDFIKPYLDNEKYHENGSRLLSIPLRYINTNKFLKGFIFKNKEEIKKSFSEDEIKKIDLFSEHFIKSAYSTYMSVLVATLYSFDTDKNFMDQIGKVEKDIKIKCLEIIATFNRFGIDFSSNSLTEEDKQKLQEISDELQTNFEEYYTEIIKGEQENDKR